MTDNSSGNSWRQARLRGEVQVPHVQGKGKWLQEGLGPASKDVTDFVDSP